MKWAKCNIGAEKETDFGDYFQWGSVTPNTNTICDWEHAPFNGGYTEYNDEYFTTHQSEWLDDNVNGFPTLKPKFDAATQIMGGNWRMPTMNEFQELIDYTTNEWVTNFKGTGVNGWKFTSTTNTSKYIFIPAAGERNNGSVDSVGLGGKFWSSSLNTSNPRNAWFLYFDSDYCYMDYISRYLGLPVRGVRK